MVCRCGDDVRLLIADDDPGFRETVVEVLEPHFQTIAVESGEAAIQVVESVQVDAVLLDMHMHVLTGLETLQLVKRIRAEIACILMSSLVTVDLEDAAQRFDAFTVLRKPPSRQQLLDTIQCALKL